MSLQGLVIVLVGDEALSCAAMVRGVSVEPPRNVFVVKSEGARLVDLQDAAEFSHPTQFVDMFAAREAEGEFALDRRMVDFVVVAGTDVSEVEVRRIVDFASASRVIVDSRVQCILCRFSALSPPISPKMHLEPLLMEGRIDLVVVDTIDEFGRPIPQASLDVRRLDIARYLNLLEDWAAGVEQRPNWSTRILAHTRDQRGDTSLSSFAFCEVADFSEERSHQAFFRLFADGYVGRHKLVDLSEVPLRLGNAIKALDRALPEGDWYRLLDQVTARQPVFLFRDEAAAESYLNLVHQTIVPYEEIRRNQVSAEITGMRQSIPAIQEDLRKAVDRVLDDHSAMAMLGHTIDAIRSIEEEVKKVDGSLILASVYPSQPTYQDPSKGTIKAIRRLPTRLQLGGFAFVFFCAPLAPLLLEDLDLLSFFASVALVFSIGLAIVGYRIWTVNRDIQALVSEVSRQWFRSIDSHVEGEFKQRSGRIQRRLSFGLLQMLRTRRSGISALSAMLDRVGESSSETKGEYKDLVPELKALVKDLAGQPLFRFSGDKILTAIDSFWTVLYQPWRQKIAMRLGAENHWTDERLAESVRRKLLLPLAYKRVARVRAEEMIAIARDKVDLPESLFSLHPDGDPNIHERIVLMARLHRPILIRWLQNLQDGHYELAD
ncbi:MAG: hypothetical protein ACFHX7_21985 [Pseudomonadota bacterium]